MQSTIVQLTERFYDPVLGKVTVDGKDISEMNIQNYRSHISLVSQEPVRNDFQVECDPPMTDSLPLLRHFTLVLCDSTFC